MIFFYHNATKTRLTVGMGGENPKYPKNNNRLAVRSNDTLRNLS